MKSATRFPGRNTSYLGTAMLAVLLLEACGSPPEPAPPATSVAEPAPAAPSAVTEPAVPRTTAAVWLGDLDGMKERRAVRMLVVYNKTNYFLDGPTQRGATYDMGIELEKWLNRNNKDKARPMRVVFIPTSRNHLLTDLAEGRGDIAAAGLAITPERLKLVDFAAPFADEVEQVIRECAPSQLHRRDVHGHTPR